MPLRGPFSAGDEPEWLERYFSGECTAAESARVEHWAASDPANVAALAAARRVWEATGALPQRFSPDVALRSIRQRAAVARPPLWHRWVGEGVGVRDQRTRARVVLVAMVVAVLGIGLIVRRSLTPGLGFPIRAVREYVTTAGQRSGVTLVDGTHLTLAPGSRLRVPAAYGREARDVELEGEAYFAVTHDPARPFAVQVRGMVVRDVGTVFDVRAYAEDIHTRIAVAEGAVVVGSAPVLAGDVARVAPDGITVAHGSDVATLTRWTTGTLVYHDEPAATVVADIQRWYNVDLVVGDPSLGRRTLTMTVTPGEPMHQVLDVLCDLLGARVDRRGSRLTLVERAPGANTHELGTP